MRKFIVIAMLCLVSGCGGGEEEDCRFVRFIPEQGDSYYEYTCDNDPADVRYIPEAPQHE